MVAQPDDEIPDWMRSSQVDEGEEPAHVRDAFGPRPLDDIILEEARPATLPPAALVEAKLAELLEVGGGVVEHDTPEQLRARAFDAATLEYERDLVQGRPTLEEQFDALIAAELATEAAAAPATRRAPAGIDAADLLELQLPPLRWVVPELIPEGTTVLAAPPKVGKSCLVYQIAVECAVGGAVLGRRATPGSVLYLALEDGQRRGQDRLKAALAGRTMPRGRLEVRWSAPRIGEGLEDELAAWLDEHPDAVMVALDTLGKVRPNGDGRRNAYEVDVQHLARLQDLFRDRTVALVIVHHARKELHDDFLASVSGTYGITGSADTIAVLRRKRLEAFGTLLVTGRDVRDAELSVRFEDGTWHVAPGVVPSATIQQREVLRVIEEHGPIFPKAIADLIGSERTNVQHLVAKLVQSGAVAGTTEGYVLASEVYEPSRAHARVTSLSPLTQGENERVSDSERGHPRAQAHEPAPSIACRDYATHQTSHRRTPDGWTCDACSAEAQP